jgi:hypothetical protein
MLELTGNHIEKLNDEDLRELVFKLCEAELRKYNQPVASVTAGGSQTAPDGGVDVRVDLLAPAKLDFIPRAQTVFQVKCEDMPAGKILEEMCPGGILRASIAQLIEAQGAYIIVSSKGSVADSTLRKRCDAMRSAIKTMPNSAAVDVHFYDRNRLSNWVRGYPGVEQWVRGRIGAPLSGWQGYGYWTGDKTGSPYQRDELGRVLSKTSGTTEPMPVEFGINVIRERLSMPGESVRLIGLSGTGKTRLVQALFEAGVGTSPLDTAIVAYTDQGLSPLPSARDMMRHLGANGLRAIVVVDNCNPATHQALTQVVGTYPTFLSLITVEYDVMDDEPEETQVYELTGSSSTVLEGILAGHAPHIAQNDRLRIVEFSDGNARVALALARTVKKGQTLGVLNDTELFKRLFMQNQGPNEALLRAAEVCSLVYSFDGEALDSVNAELPILAALANQQPNELFRQVAELKRRKLVQTRGKWRAVLPHALANRLAKQALGNLPQTQIMSAFEGHERLLKSFSRRLSYLHDSPEACAIAKSWMTDEKWLANPCRLNELGLSLFFNLAPLVPEKALDSIEAAISSEQGDAFTAPSWPSHNRWMTLAHQLAYESNLFDRAARICLAFAVAEKAGTHAGCDMWKELFQLYLSGTLAPPQLRINLLRGLLSKGTPRQQQIAVEGLAAMLTASHFRSSHNFSFGARPRDYGWAPASTEENRTWYGGLFELVLEFSKPGSAHRTSIRAAVARHLRSLWSNLGMQDEVAALVRSMAGSDGWPSAWTATRIALRYDSKTMPLKYLEMLKELEQLLRPATLEQRVRAYVFADNWVLADAEEDDEAVGASRANSYERVTAAVKGLAREVTVDQALLLKLLPDLLSNGTGQQYWFGQGLAAASPDIAAYWCQLVAAFVQLEPSRRDTRMLAGFVEGAQQVNASAADVILDSAVHDPILAGYFPLLQVSQCNDAAGQRLLASLEHSVAPIWSYDWFKYGLLGKGMSPVIYREILLKLAQLPDGFQIAINSLGMAFFRIRSEHIAPSVELLSLGRELLGMFNFDVKDENCAYRLGEVADVCMQGPDATTFAVNFCQRFADALQNSRCDTYSLGSLLETLFKHQPTAALDAFFGTRSAARGYSLISQYSRSEKNVLNVADAGSLLAWVKAEPAVRAPLLASEIGIHCIDAHGAFTWSPMAASLLEIAPNRQHVLDGFAQHFYPQCWSGNIADVLRPYHEWVKRLANDADADIAAWAGDQLTLMTERIARERSIDQRTDERFE